MTLALLLVAAVGYPAAAARSRRPWPAARTASWLAGVAVAGAVLAGPLGTAHDLRAHMAGHLLLGMVAPVLLALARPVTLALRALPPPTARRLVRVLRSAPVRVLTDPVVATAVDAAGLWLLYRGGLLIPALHSPGLHLLVGLHVLLTGWLATSAVLALEPAPHRRSVTTRAVVLAAGAASHDVLAKTLVAAPPDGLPGAADAARLMYDGGTVVHLVVAGLLWRQWYLSRGAVREAELAAAR